MLWHWKASLVKISYYFTTTSRPRESRRHAGKIQKQSLLFAGSRDGLSWRRTMWEKRLVFGIRWSLADFRTSLGSQIQEQTVEIFRMCAKRSVWLLFFLLKDFFGLVNVQTATISSCPNFKRPTRFCNFSNTHFNCSGNWNISPLVFSSFSFSMKNNPPFCEIQPSDSLIGLLSSCGRVLFRFGLFGRTLQVPFL